MDYSLDSVFDSPSPADYAGETRLVSDFMREFREDRRRKAGIPDRDPEYEAQEGICDVISAIVDRAPIVLVSGRAGTGKSRLIQYISALPGGDRQVVVAPTGVAALALRAATIHSLFRLPVGVVDTCALQPDERFGPVLRKMERLVIDEISMVRADLLDGIDARLRHLRNPDMPFGGVQVVMVGDFLQLPPVVIDEDRQLLERLGYATPFAFSAKALESTPIRVATLTRVWRQSDPEMIRALGWIREGRHVAEAIAWLNDRCARPHRSGPPPLLLTATRAAADRYNDEGVASLRASAPPRSLDEIEITANSTGSFENDAAVLPVPKRQSLIVGLRVMAVKNDPAGEYVNGSLGFVTAVHPVSGPDDCPAVSVRFDGHEGETVIKPVSWLKTRQVWNEDLQEIEESTTGVYEQIPLVVGYAITIHKSQGLSLDDVRIDLGNGAFAPGQLYVALSRARSVEGLSLARPIELRDVKVDEMLLAFLGWARTAGNLQFQAKGA